MQKITALVIGATGLVGSHLINEILKDERYEKVVAFSRRPLDIQHVKLECIIVDFEKLAEVKDSIKGDVLFSCLGTTRKKAGSSEKFHQVDYTYQYNFIQLAAENGVRELILISSPGANPKAFYSLYLKTKGELDEAVKRLPFERIVYIRPSLLEGDRAEYRAGEKIGAIIGNALAHLAVFKKYRPIKGETVASAMAKLPFDNKLTHLQNIEFDDLFRYNSTSV